MINILFIHRDDDKWGVDMYRLYNAAGRNSIRSIYSCHWGFINVEIIPLKFVASPTVWRIAIQQGGYKSGDNEKMFFLLI